MKNNYTLFTWVKHPIFKQIKLFLFSDFHKSTTSKLSSMHYANKMSVTLIIFLLSIVPSSYSNIFTDSNEYVNSISKENAEKSFYQEYNSNWKKVAKYNSSSFWNAKEAVTISNSTTTATMTDKELFYQANGLSSKSNSKVSFSFNQSKSSSSSSNVCTPETTLTITQSNSSLGNARSTLNNSGVPSFCLDYSKNAPIVGNDYDTTLTPNTDISFNNNSTSHCCINQYEPVSWYP